MFWGHAVTFTLTRRSFFLIKVSTNEVPVKCPLQWAKLSCLMASERDIHI